MRRLSRRSAERRRTPFSRRLRPRRRAADSRPRQPAADSRPRRLPSTSTRSGSASTLLVTPTAMDALDKRVKEPFLAAVTPLPGEHRTDSERLDQSTPDPATCTSTAAARGGTFVPGYVFANRYRMIARIGRGGMGEVWRADDLVLQTPVALKLIYATGPEGR